MLDALIATVGYPISIALVILAGVLLSRRATAKAGRPVPRRQQGMRPGAFGDTWDAMTPAERRGAAIGDVAVASCGALAILWLGALFEALH